MIGLKIKDGSRVSDLVIASLLVAIMALMVVPVSPALLDLLVAVNIAGGIVLLLMSVYIVTPLNLTSFPSVLLLTTLFRLSLSVATTRMILLEGDAGDIITTFGNAVAGGNVVVGLVVFFIITIVQMIVVAKGAERIAEVGARFTLDAMPGKQLSIDSDLRAGILNKDQAKSKRELLHVESKFHGSMDGAMKFVKGDAIAGIVIILVNLLGGLSVGVGQQGMGLSEAIGKYSILTIGDGMIAQIPALLAAIAAGLIVTRVTAQDDENSNLGMNIRDQFSRIPRALFVGAALCVLLAFVPGFPGFTFLGVAVFLVVVCASITSQREGLVASLGGQLSKDSKARVQFEKYYAVKADKIRAEKTIKPVYALTLALPDTHFSEMDMRLLTEKLGHALSALQDEMGVLIPDIELEIVGSDQDVVYKIYEHAVLRLGSEQFTDLDGGNERSIEALVQSTKENLYKLVGVRDINIVLAELSKQFPESVAGLQQNLTLHTITAVFRMLLKQQMPLRNVRGMLEDLTEASELQKDLAPLVETSRIAMKTQTCSRLSQEGILNFVCLSPELEQRCMELFEPGQNADTFVAGLKVTIKNEIMQVCSDSQCLVLLSTLQIRQSLFDLLFSETRAIQVLSYNELDENFTLNKVGTIDIPL